MRRGRADTRNGCWSLPRTAPLLPLGPVLFPAVGEVRLVLIDYFFFFFSRMERCFFFTRLEGKSHNPTKYNNNNTENPLKHLFFLNLQGHSVGGGWRGGGRLVRVPARLPRARPRGVRGRARTGSRGVCRRRGDVTGRFTNGRQGAGSRQPMGGGAGP